MKNFGTKIDNDETSAGVVVADEYNSAFSEMKGAVSPFLNLNEQDNKQLGKSIDIASKAMFYNDVGTPNAVHLTRGATNEQIETLFDGMVVFFSPANQNTGASTLKVNALGAKAMKFNDSALVAGMLIIGVKYIAVYKISDDSFHIDVIATGNDISKTVVNDAGTIEDINGNKIAPSMSDFMSQNSAHGYQKIANGIIIQWSSGLASPTGYVNNLPISFPNAQFFALAVHDGGGGDTSTIDACRADGLSQVYVSTPYHANIGCNFMSVGY